MVCIKYLTIILIIGILFVFLSTIPSASHERSTSVSKYRAQLRCDRQAVPNDHSKQIENEPTVSKSYEEAIDLASMCTSSNRKLIAFTSGNLAIHRFMINLQLLIQKLHNPFPLIHVPLDEKCLSTLTSLSNISLNILDIGKMKNTFPSDGAEFRQKAYNQMALVKWKLALEFLKLGVDVLVLDPDIVLLRNPIPYFDTIPPCDMSFQIDSFTNYSSNFIKAHGGYSFEDLGNYHIDNFYNTGFILHRSNLRTISHITEYLKHAESEYEHGANVDDQNIWNHWMQDNMHYANVGINSPLTERGQYAYAKIVNGECFEYVRNSNSSNIAISINALTPALFPSRPQLFEVKQLDELLMRPFMWHANWLFGLESKERLIRENNQWLVQ